MDELWSMVESMFMMQSPVWLEADEVGCQRSRERGLTAIELMVTIGIVAILLAIAIPSFDAWRQSTALASADASLVAHLKQARLIAISQNRSVNIVFTPGTPGSYTVDSGGTDQHTYNLREYSPKLTLANTFTGNTLTFNSDGSTSLTSATLTSNSNTVTISNATGSSKTSKVNIVGEIS